MSPTLLLAAALAAPPAAGFTAKVPVAEPTRLDWTFAVTNQSLAAVPKELLADGYDSAKQTYDLYLPPRADAKTPVPCVLFISASDDSAGWKAFEPACTKLGFAFVGVRGAGNGVPPPKRVRIVLDCLDDLRRKLPLDPDRTYVSGFSGGARMACAIGFALPEHVGGVLPLCAGGDLRSEPWLRHRAIDRLSAALVTGTTDFNRGEVERWRGPLWADLGIRTKVWVQPNLGHGLPPAATLAEALGWLEEGRAGRAALAKKVPTTRIDGTPTRAEQADALLAEAKAKVSDAKTAYRGLMLLKGASARWPDLPAGKAALKLLVEYDGKRVRPWEADDIAEQRKELAAEARALSGYALHGVPPNSQYAKLVPDMARKAAGLWKQVIDDAPDSAAAKEGRVLLAELEPLTTKR